MKIVMEVYDSELGNYCEEIQASHSMIQLSPTRGCEDRRCIIHLCEDVDEWYKGWKEKEAER